MAEGRIPQQDDPDVQVFEWYIDAYKELCTCKRDDASAIPFTSIVEYFKIYGEGDFDEFLYIMRRMDNTLIESIKNKSKQKSQGKNDGGSSTANNSKIRHPRK